MQAWKYSPAELAVVRAFVDGDPLDQAGGPLDVRTVVAAIRPEAKDGFLIEEVPWERFPDGTDMRKDLEQDGPRSLRFGHRLDTAPEAFLDTDADTPSEQCPDGVSG
ncbi:hypothetical protein ACIRST_41865 [Kitasatospora sp. NPDC101447]|uniref:hypothetical protein n=1 Tax=Kitasatospora sp. NPDC101447 TaxID=3364102 RepID=UPI00382214E9